MLYYYNFVRDECKKKTYAENNKSKYVQLLLGSSYVVIKHH